MATCIRFRATGSVLLVAVLCSFWGAGPALAAPVAGGVSVGVMGSGAPTAGVQPYGVVAVESAANAPLRGCVSTLDTDGASADEGSKPADGDRFRLPQPHLPQLAPLGRELGKAHGLDHLLAQRTTNYLHASLSQTKNIELLAKRLNGTVVEPGQTFSYYKTVGPYTEHNGYHWGRAFSNGRIVPSMGGGVCQGASTLYSALLRTGLPVVERHAHSLTVPYLPPGEDATVAGNYMDFRFRNDRATPVVIAAATDAGRRYLTVAIWGDEASPPIVVRHEILQRIPYRVIRRCSKNASDGDVGEKILFPGQAGVKVRSWLEIKTDDGVRKKSLGVDQYRPSPRVVETRPGSTGCPH